MTARWIIVYILLFLKEYIPKLSVNISIMITVIKQLFISYRFHKKKNINVQDICCEISRKTSKEPYIYKNSFQCVGANFGHFFEFTGKRERNLF